MTALSDKMKSIAASLTSRYGESCTFSRVVEGAYNTSTSTPAAGTSSSYTAYVVPIRDTRSNDPGTTTLGKGESLLVYHATSVPTVGDTVSYNSSTYRIVSVEVTRLSGVSIIYQVVISI